MFYPQKASKYTEEEHTERISKLVEERYINENKKYTGYKVFPLYNESEELAYFLIELEPVGYVYVQINTTYLFLQMFGGVSMYTRDDGRPWQRYKICEDGQDSMSNEDGQWEVEKNEYGYAAYPNKRWEIDETGEFVYYVDSHFKIANIENEKRYLLKIYEGSSTGFIPAVKRGDEYLNLVSMEEMEYKKEVKLESYSIAYIAFNCKAMEDL